VLRICAYGQECARQIVADSSLYLSVFLLLHLSADSIMPAICAGDCVDVTPPGCAFVCLQTAMSVSREILLLGRGRESVSCLGLFGCLTSSLLSWHGLLPGNCVLRVLVLC
jgi:hypothetical protein